MIPREYAEDNAAAAAAGDDPGTVFESPDADRVWDGRLWWPGCGGTAATGPLYIVGLGVFLLRPVAARVAVGLALVGVARLSISVVVGCWPALQRHAVSAQAARTFSTQETKCSKCAAAHLAREPWTSRTRECGER